MKIRDRLANLSRRSEYRTADANRLRAPLPFDGSIAYKLQVDMHLVLTTAGEVLNLRKQILSFWALCFRTHFRPLLQEASHLQIVERRVPIGVNRRKHWKNVSIDVWKEGIKQILGIINALNLSAPFVL